jgi:hypothetical protein
MYQWDLVGATPDLPFIAKFLLACAMFVLGTSVLPKRQISPKLFFVGLLATNFIVYLFHIGFPFVVTNRGYEQANLIGVLASIIGLAGGFAVRCYGKVA